MDNTTQFDFFYGTEAEQFSFYRIPRLLVKEEKFKGLSSDAKLLYGLMLDRMSLSIKNGWLDDENRAYIIYTVENIAEDLGCSKPTCTKIMQELDTVHGIGLIEKKRKGLGRPDIIYVKNFNVKSQNTLASGDKEIESQEVKDFGVKKQKSLTSGNKETKSQEIKDFDFKKQRFLTSGNEEIESQEITDFDLRRQKILTCGDKGIESQEVKDFSPSYTNINNNDQSYIDMNYSYPIHQPEDESAGEEKYPGIGGKSYVASERGMLADTDGHIAHIRSNLAYDHYMQYAGYKEKELFQEIYEIICDVVCVRRKSLRINGEEYPYELVKARFMKLNNSHVEYVIDCMQRNTTKVTNIRAYLITALYNAPTTIKHYYQQEVQHDMYGDGWVEKGVESETSGHYVQK